MAKLPKFESTLADTHSHIRVYDISTGEEILHIADVPDVWQGLRFSPNGDRLAAAGANHRSILIWNFEKEQRVMTRHGVVKAADLAFSPDGGRIAVGSRTVTKVINAYTAEDLLILRTSWQLAPSNVTFQPYVCWSPDGRSLAVTSHDRKLSIWSIPPHRSPRSLAELGQEAERRAVTHAPAKGLYPPRILEQ